MQNETKKPCGPEAGGREYAEVFRETDPLCAALDELCAELNCWYEAMRNPLQREDRTYRRELAKRTQAALKRVLHAEDESTEEELHDRCHKLTVDHDKS